MLPIYRFSSIRLLLHTFINSNSQINYSHTFVCLKVYRRNNYYIDGELKSAFVKRELLVRIKGKMDEMTNQCVISTKERFDIQKLT